MGGGAFSFCFFLCRRGREGRICKVASGASVIYFLSVPSSGGLN